MSEGPFRDDASAREARIEALEEEVEELRHAKPEDGARLAKRVEQLTNENAKLRKRLDAAEVRASSRKPLTDSNAILEWSVGALLVIAMIIGATQNCSGH